VSDKALVVDDEVEEEADECHFQIIVRWVINHEIFMMENVVHQLLEPERQVQEQQTQEVLTRAQQTRELLILPQASDNR
jgi:hypothetical protein